MRAPITLSLHLPNFNYPGIEPDGLFEHLADIARTAEDSGFSSITVSYKIDADATPDEIKALVAQSQKRSAVYDIITNPTDVRVEVV